MGVLNLFRKPDSERTIRVEFVNGADNSVIAVSEMPPDRLPDSFAIDTNLDIKEFTSSIGAGITISSDAKAFENYFAQQ